MSGDRVCRRCEESLPAGERHERSVDCILGLIRSRDDLRNELIAARGERDAARSAQSAVVERHARLVTEARQLRARFAESHVAESEDLADETPEPDPRPCDACGAPCTVAGAYLCAACAPPLAVPWTPERRERVGRAVYEAQPPLVSRCAWESAPDEMREEYRVLGEAAVRADEGAR